MNSGKGQWWLIKIDIPLGSMVSDMSIENIENKFFSLYRNFFIICDLKRF